MSEPDDDPGRKRSPVRKYRWRYGPLRLVGPWIAVGAGLIVVITHAGGLSKSGDENTTSMFIAGLVVIVLGVIAFFVYRWMARRGI